MIKIRAVNHENKDEIAKIMDLIYNVFTIRNSKDASEKLTKRYSELFGPKADFGNTLKRFKDSDCFLIATDGEEIIGMIRGKSGKIINLYVDTRYEGQGIGGSLLHQFEEEGKKKGIKTVILKSSIYAKEFYIKKGFSKKDGQYLEKNIA